VAKVDQSDNSISKEMKESSGLQKKKIIDRQVSYVITPSTNLFFDSRSDFRACLLAIDYNESGNPIVHVVDMTNSWQSLIEDVDLNSSDCALMIKCKYHPQEIVIDKVTHHHVYF
jgi:hypothetical protein